MTIVGPLNLPSTMPDHASSLYARNVQSLLELMVEEGELKLDFDDEVIAGRLHHARRRDRPRGRREAAGAAA